MENKWFELRDVVLDTTKYNDFESLKRNKDKAFKITNTSRYLQKCEINGKLLSFEKLTSASGHINTFYIYYIKINLYDFIKQSQIDIYDDTINGMEHILSIKFSSGSIISKIVFSNIEQAYFELKDIIDNKIKEYNQYVDNFNQEIDNLTKEEE